MEKLVTRKTASLLDTSKAMIPQKKKLKSKSKHSQVLLTSKQYIIDHKKSALSFKFMKTQVMSGSKDQKERKTANTVTTFFSDKKSPQRKFASATIANPVELMIGTTMNISI